jgi:hypothetical protein
MRTAWIAICALLCACSGPQDSGDGQGTTPNEPGDDTTLAESLEPDSESLVGAVTTETLHHVLGRSAGDFLRLVEVEAETEGGSFVGWRLVSLPESQPSWLDIRTGDVVTAINGLPLERPEDAQRVWEMLQVASEVRIDSVRNGERRALRIPVEEGDSEAPVEDPAERRGPEE